MLKRTSPLIMAPSAVLCEQGLKRECAYSPLKACKYCADPGKLLHWDTCHSQHAHLLLEAAGWASCGLLGARRCPASVAWGPEGA